MQHLQLCRAEPIHAGRMKSQKYRRSESQLAIQTNFSPPIFILQSHLPLIRKLRTRSNVKIKFVTSLFRSSNTGAAVDDDD